MTRHAPVRLPWEPVERFIAAAFPPVPMERRWLPGTKPLEGLRGFAEATGLSISQLCAWKKAGCITTAAADRIACALGRHPFELWGDAWWQATDLDLVSA